MSKRIPKIKDGCFDITHAALVWECTKAPKELKRLIKPTPNLFCYMVLYPPSFNLWRPYDYFEKDIEVEGEPFKLVMI